ncbi:MAG: hypothetical protein HYY06_09960 [Deltaproteobacteria bacterium]|nr:hypothetical protein [Deltaproteobacteria bacterium]
MILSTLLAACAGGLSDSDQLAEAISHFNDDVRWGNYESASLLMAPAARRAFLGNLNETTHGGELQSADYEVVGIAPQRNGGALVRVDRAWYLLSDSELHRGSFVQRWERHDGDWLMVGERELSPN